MSRQEKFDLIVRARDEASAALAGITKNVVGMVAAFATVRTVTGFLKDSVTAAIESEAVFNDLGAAVDRHGGNWDAMKESMQGALSAMMRDLGLSDEALARSAQVFIDYGANGKRSLELVAVAADLAAGKHMSLEAATELLAKASVGNTTMLARYGIVLSESIPKAERFEQALALINEQFGGRAQVQMQTAAGQLALLNEQYGELKENIGGLVIGPMTDLLTQMNTMLTVVNNLQGGWAKFLLVVRMVGSGGGANIAASFREWNELMADATVAVEKFAWSQKDIFARFPDFNNNLDRHSTEIAKVAKEYHNANVELGEWQRMQSDYQTFAPSRRNTEYEAMQDAIEGVRKGTRELNQQLNETAVMVYDTLTTNLTNGFTAMLTGMESVREGLQNIFMGILADFTRMVTQMLVKWAALQFLNFAIPGFGSVLGSLTSSSIQPPTGAVVATGQRMAASAGGVTINIGTIIGEEQYIRKVFVPILERDARLNMNRLSLRA